MKLLTLIQAAALSILAVMGAYASSAETPVCKADTTQESCEL